MWWLGQISGVGSVFLGRRWWVDLGFLGLDWLGPLVGLKRGRDILLCVGLVKGLIVQFCDYFVNDCIDLIFGFKSIFSFG